MSALAKIQRDFCQFVRGHGHQDFLRHIQATSLPKEALLDIYHKNVFSVHMRSLKSDYPLVFSIMGLPAARAMAFAYIETSFPATGSLEDWGGGLIPFIQTYGPAVAWPYLEDIAQYEWAKHIACCAEEGPLLTPEDMEQLIAPEQEEPTFHFQKSCQLMAFSHSLEPIISAHQQNQKQPLPETQGSSYILILKHQGIIKTYWLTPALFVFVNRLKEGQGVDVAFAAARVLEPRFDAKEAFSFLFSRPMLQR